MRGLENFIKELRDCRLKEQEVKRVNQELANIRSKFSENRKLDGYGRKKYVAKLIFIYILGYKIDFGYIEIIGLLTARNYTEKQMGYLALATLLESREDLSDAVLHCIRQDLDEMNEISNCLALQAIANVCSQQMANEFVKEIYKMAVETLAPKTVRKKAILCLLRIYRKFPGLIPVQDWYGKLIGLIDQYDLTVSHAATSLILCISQTSPEFMADCIPRVIYRLYKIVVESEYSDEHIYYHVPCPWIQIKLLQLLSQFPFPNDPELKNKSEEILQKIMTQGIKVIAEKPGLQQENIVKAILFQAMRVILIADNSLVAEAVSILGKFITSSDTNTRYLALETLSAMKQSAALELLMHSHHENVILCLKDRDVSICKKTADLLYAMCNAANATRIVKELLDVLATAETSFKEDLMLRIAVLAEKYATELSWYFEVILKLLASLHEQENNDIWFRAVQIIVNNPELHEFACVSVYQNIRSSAHMNASLLQLTGYILGEFGEKLNGIATPLDIFKALHAKFETGSVKTKALLLTSYLKMAGKFPEMADYLMPVFQCYRSSTECELQKRAGEYYNLLRSGHQKLIAGCLEKMPGFSENEKPTLLLRLETKLFSAKNSLPKQSHSDKISPLVQSPLQSETAFSKNAHLTEKMQVQNRDDYRRSILLSSSVLFENSVLQIGVRSEFKTHFGRLALYFGNKTENAIRQLSVSVSHVEGIDFELTQNVASMLSAADQQFQVYQLLCRRPFDALQATLCVSYSDTETSHTLEMRLPIAISKFMIPVDLSAQDFLQRWQQVGGSARSIRREWTLHPDWNHENILDVVAGLNFSVLKDVDPCKDNITGASIFKCSELGQIGCLMRLECQFSTQMLLLTVNSTHETVSFAVANLFESLLRNDVTNRVSLRNSVD